MTVSSRLTGEIGSSSNPISGMTVATLLLTCLIFLIVGWSGPSYYVTALSIGGIVCIAASNGGTTSQDLKTGFLVGATPKYQQIAILVGALASALILGPILLRLNDQSTVYVPQTTFRAMQNGQQIDSAAAAALPAYTETVSRLGRWQLQVAQERRGSDTSSLVSNRASISSTAPAKSYTGSSETSRRLCAPDMANLGPAETRQERGSGHGRSKQYRTWHKSRRAEWPSGQVPGRRQGNIKYYVDPGINGTHRVAPDGSSVTKYDAPKATLMSYIIKGILNQQAAVGPRVARRDDRGRSRDGGHSVAGICGGRLSAAVVVARSSSAAWFVGSSKVLRVKFQKRKLTEEEWSPKADKSPGVLMASGYIAGGAIGGGVHRFLRRLVERQAGIDLAVV